MPMDQAAVDAELFGATEAMPEVDEAVGETERAVREEIGTLAPEAVEPLPAPAVNSLHETLARAWDELGDGQVQLPPMPPVEGDLEFLPPELFAPLAALAAFTQALPEAQPYQFDPVELGQTEDGLLEMVGIIGSMARDRKLARAIRRAQPPQEQAPAPEAPAPPGGADSELEALL